VRDVPRVRQRLAMLASKERGSDLEDLTPLLGVGTLKSSVDTNYLLDEVPEAMRHLESGKVRGKVAIVV
jgi:NADPH:quinone reductase-like Zn-dependent oxidoreductase